VRPSLVPASDLSTQVAVPAVPIDQSVTDEAVTCLCCGKSFTMLKRHLKAEHGLTEQQYRLRFALSEKHPLVAPNYSIRKAEYAKRIGLGKYTRDDVESHNSLPSA
jgi:predicted transcriptional regulator